MDMLSIDRPQIELLEKLCNALSVSGDEEEVRRIILDEVKTVSDEVSTDAVGNLLVRRKASSKGVVRVLLDAHMDEVGFMIVHDDEQGFYQFETIGRIDPRILPGKQVQIGRDHASGVIGVKPHHLTAEQELEQAVSLESLQIDMGPQGRAKIGERGTFVSNFRRIGPSIMSKAIDDRIGVAILIELLKHAPDNIEMCVCFSAQEEVGLRGATVAARHFQPDLAIAVDSTSARDLPGITDRENSTYNSKLGLGPAISMMNSSAIDDPRLVQFLEQTARAKDIPFQFRQPGHGGTNAGAIQQTRMGVPVVSVSVPHRYPHSPASICRIVDWKNTLNLLYAALGRLTPGIMGD